MYKVTQEIEQALVDSGVKVDVLEQDNICEVRVRFPLEYSAPVDIRFLNTDEDHDTLVRVDLMRVGEDKEDAVLMLLNQFNNQYRYAKFTLTDEYDVFLSYDFCVNGGNMGDGVKEILLRFLKIMKQTHEQLLRAVLA